MKKITYLIIFLITGIVFIPTNTFAGNSDRVGQAGATELLINPWARSSGFHGINTSTVRGLEAMRLNVGGLSFTPKTEILFAGTIWLMGSETNISAFGLAQRLGDKGVIGLNVTSMSFGEIDRTTVNNPEGGVGTFQPQFMNIGLAYSRSFSESIHVGFLVRMISESIEDATASGLCLDMGIQYVTGLEDQIKFGISLRNIGTPLRYRGDGLAVILKSPDGYNLTVDSRAEKFELPTALNIGASYDFNINAKHRVTVMGNFTSNSFYKDQLGAGIEYAFNEMFMLRGAYRYEEGITGALGIDQRTSAYTGLAAGASVEVPLRKAQTDAEEDKTGISLGIDYSYRMSDPYSGTHTIGVRINL